MKKFVWILFSLLLVTSWAAAAEKEVEVVYAEDQYCILGYRGTPKLPWCEYCVHDADRPVPPVMKLNPAEIPFLSPPEDAQILFDYHHPSLEAWKPEAFEKGNWKLAGNYLEAHTGGVASKAVFSDAHIHVEWRYPKDYQGDWGNQGNNGVLILGIYEIQIFNSQKYRINPDGMAGAIYGQTPPLVNVALPEGEWQSYDIFFQAGKWDGKTCLERPRVTILHNGVLIQNNAIIYGKTHHKILPEDDTGCTTGPLILSGHHCPVQFRSVWVRNLSK
ncbi:MAG: DUF1080 domain-containing protein [Planctomycetia bacterium]|nr:DUF1080 domain-containing protein [Planctomycetia bacterium]